MTHAGQASYPREAAKPVQGPQRFDVWAPLA